MAGIDGDRLIALARANDAASRQALLLTLGDLCAERPFGLGDQARTAEEIFLRLARNAELMVRAELAARLAATPWAPRALILFLAEDDIAAAGPVLTQSPVLREADLVGIASRLGAAHRLALARRPGLPGAAGEAVAQAGETAVIRVLLDNPTAEIAAPAFRHCAAAARLAPDLWPALIAREGLSEDVVEAAYRAAGDALREEIVRRYPQFVEQLEEEADAATSAAIQRRLIGPGLSADERLVEELAETGGLTGIFLREAIEDRREALFELGLARMCACPTQILRRAMGRRPAMALALALRAAGLDSVHCGRILRALGAAGRPGPAPSRDDCIAVWRDYSQQTAGDALRQLGADA